MARGRRRGGSSSASRPDILAAGRGDVWDSGKVASAESVNVTYGGRPLRSRERVHWKVQAWDERDRPGPWSAPAEWTMGLLEQGRLVGALDSRHRAVGGRRVGHVPEARVHAGAARGARHRPRQRARPLRTAHQRPARRRPPARARVDGLHDAGSVPGVRRDVAPPAGRQRRGGHGRRRLVRRRRRPGHDARSRSRGTSTARHRACSSSSRCSTRTARRRRSSATAPGAPRGTGPSARPTSSTARPTTRGARCPAGTPSDSTPRHGTRWTSAIRRRPARGSSRSRTSRSASPRS